jgi:hypothetical protein
MYSHCTDKVIKVNTSSRSVLLESSVRTKDQLVEWRASLDSLF